MSYTDNQLQRIYEKTGGRCACCGKQLSFGNYGTFGIGRRGHWEVGHWRSRASGGSNRLSNLLAMCFDCNRGMGPRNATWNCRR